MPIRRLAVLGWAVGAGGYTLGKVIGEKGVTIFQGDDAKPRVLSNWFARQSWGPNGRLCVLCAQPVNFGELERWHREIGERNIL